MGPPSLQGSVFSSRTRLRLSITAFTRLRRSVLERRHTYLRGLMMPIHPAQEAPTRSALEPLFLLLPAVHRLVDGLSIRLSRPSARARSIGRSFPRVRQLHL